MIFSFQEEEGKEEGEEEKEEDEGEESRSPSRVEIASPWVEVPSPSSPPSNIYIYLHSLLRILIGLKNYL